jgi:hypothetical protein
MGRKRQNEANGVGMVLRGNLWTEVVSWPSFNEGTILSMIVWCFRNVEGVL